MKTVIVIRIILFFTLGFKYSIGHQIKLFTEKVEQLGFTDQRKRSLWYLREIWFAVDESGFSSAEHILLSGTLMKSINNWSKLNVPLILVLLVL